MKTYRSRIVALFCLAVFLTSSSLLFSQENDQMKRFRQEKINYFNEKLDLSEEEKKVFWPIYHEHFNQIMKINEDEKSLLSFYKNNSEYMSEAEVDETIEKHFGIREKRHKLELKYHDRFVEAIGKKKTMKMYTLEREYRMHVLRKFRGSGQGQHQGKGRRGPRQM